MFPTEDPHVHRPPRRGGARPGHGWRAPGRGPGGGRQDATSWADGTTHEALQVIAEGITQLAGFGVAAVSVVRDSQHMQVMAVAGSDEARDTLQGTYTPITRLMEEIEQAEDWGMFKFVPHESLDPDVESWGWVPDLEPSPSPTPGTRWTCSSRRSTAPTAR